MSGLWILAFAAMVLFVFPASAQTIRVNPEACQWAETYQPSQDVAYRPGVDVNGKAVVPADLNADVIAPKDFDIKITADLAKWLKLPPSVLYDAEAKLGYIEVRGNELFYNGQPLGDQGTAALSALCTQTTARSD